MFSILNKIPQLSKWLDRHSSTQPPWSTCELGLSEGDYQGLLRDLIKITQGEFREISRRRARVATIQKTAVSEYDLLGFALTVAMSECGRRESIEGQFWTPIARKFANAEWCHQIFTVAEQPTQLCRDLLENAAYHFNLRHVHGRVGGQNWYVSLLLQIGFTRRGFERRLPEWLAGAPAPISVGCLLGLEGERILRSAAFSSLWDGLWHYRKGNRTKEQALSCLESSRCWIMPEWRDTLIRLALERRDMDSRYDGGRNTFEEPEAIDEETDSSFLAQPCLVWNGSDAPVFKTEFINLATLPLCQKPHYVVRIGTREIRLIRQPDGAYIPMERELRLSSLAPVQTAEIIAPSGEVVASQTLQLYPDDAEISVFDLRTGYLLGDPDSLSLKGDHPHAIVLTADLLTNPVPNAEYPLDSQGKKIFLFQPLDDAWIRVCLDGETFCDIGSVARPQLSHNIHDIQLRWENAHGKNNTGQGIASLQLPENYCLRRVRKDGKTIYSKQKAGRSLSDFKQLDNAHMSRPSSTWEIGPFAISPSDYLNDIRLDLCIHYEGSTFNIRRHLAIPYLGVWWQHDNIISEFSSKKPIHTAYAKKDRFLVKLDQASDMKVDNDTAVESHRRHALMEGACFHRHLSGVPKPFGQLHGYGQPLVVRDGIYNQTENKLIISDSVIDTGCIVELCAPNGDMPHLKLHQPLWTQEDHRIIVVRPDLSLKSFSCKTPAGKENIIELPPEALAENYLTIGLFYRGARLGSIWNHKQYGIFDGPPANVGKIIRIIRVFKCPILSQQCAGMLRQLLHENIPTFVETWMPESNNPIQIDNLEFEAPGLDDGSAYAFSELAGLNPIDIDGGTAEILIGRYDDDPTASHEKTLEALDKTLRELSRLSPCLAAGAVRAWLMDPYIISNKEYSKKLTSELCQRLLEGKTETQLLEQASQIAKADTQFIERHLRGRQMPNWNINVSRLILIAPFRFLITRAFLNGL